MRAKRHDGAGEARDVASEFFQTTYCTKKKRVSRELSVLEIWCIEQKMFVFAYKIDIRGEPARPGPARPDPARPGPARPSRSLIAYISGTVR